MWGHKRKVRGLIKKISASDATGAVKYNLVTLVVIMILEHTAAFQVPV